MSKNFGTVPAGATQQPKAFELHIEEKKLEDFKTLLKLSPVAKETYENQLDDGHGNFGVGRKWIVDAKKYWEEEFDWQVTHTNFSMTSYDSHSLTSHAGARKNPT